MKNLLLFFPATFLKHIYTFFYTIYWLHCLLFHSISVMVGGLIKTKIKVLRMEYSNIVEYKMISLTLIRYFLSSLIYFFFVFGTRPFHFLISSYYFYYYYFFVQKDFFYALNWEFAFGCEADKNELLAEVSLQTFSFRIFQKKNILINFR